MISLNRAQIIGSLVDDPEVRYTQAGLAAASMVVATSDRIQGRSGEWEVHTELHRVILWGKLAEITEKHLAKGRLVYIEGRMQLRSWQDRNGNDRFTTEIVGERMQLLSGTGVAAPVWPNQGRSDATGDVRRA